MTARLPSASFEALGTTVTVVTAQRADLLFALAVVRAEVAALDAAASRFRADSELTRLNHRPGQPTRVSPILWEAINDALGAAEATGGLVTPAVGEAMVLAGYDRDFSTLAASGPPATYRLRQVPGWHRIRLSRANRTVTVPPGVCIDLGATAKAGSADRAARAAAVATGGGVLANLGGDLAVAGPPPAGGWAVRIADRHDAPAGAPAITVALGQGGLATSGTAARRWSRNGQVLHHIIDPATAAPAATPWRTVTVAAGSCLEANIASTASIILGAAAPSWLEHQGLHARLVAEDGRVVTTGAWPAEPGGPWKPERLAS